MKIAELKKEPTLKVYYEQGFMNVIESYVEYLKGMSVLRTIDPNDIAVYKGDFYGYLNKLNIPLHLQWIILRVNDMTHSCQFDENMSIIRIPPSTEIDRIKKIYTNTPNDVGI